MRLELARVYWRERLSCLPLATATAEEGSGSVGCGGLGDGGGGVCGRGPASEGGVGSGEGGAGGPGGDDEGCGGLSVNQPERSLRRDNLEQPQPLSAYCLVCQRACARACVLGEW